jgi:ribosomal protein L30/L7E
VHVIDESGLLADLDLLRLNGRNSCSHRPNTPILTG